jgi:pimeloyl-ACP methyl ester carboxylesterase
MIAGLDTQKRLAELTCPTLVLVGEEDSSTQPAAAQLIAEQIPGALVEAIVGVSHMEPVEAPEAVTHLIDVFLSSLSARTTGE